MKKVEDKILSVIEQHRMISAGDTVVVAVSGGADSMCLLHFFNIISSSYGFNIICAHVNHGIRGEEADRDEKFVRDFCYAHCIRFESAHFDVPAISAETGESEEQCGRRLRYDFFSSIGENIKIATAHNLNDCEETFLFNLSRGTGLKGLTGIPPVRDNIIRPLIECTREEIEAYLKFYSVKYINDSTNFCDDYSRNKIRHNIIPVLCEMNPNFHSVFKSCISSLSDTENYIAKNVEIAFDKAMEGEKFHISDILLLDDIIRNRLLIRIAAYFGAHDIGATHIHIINELLYKGGAVMLPGSVTVAADKKFLFKVMPSIEENYIFLPYSKSESTYCFQSGTVFVVNVDKNKINDYNIKQLSQLGYADSDKLNGAVFRSRIPGDRYRYPFSEHSKSLKNLFKEKNITPEERIGVPFLANDESLLWINGVGVSHEAAVTESTKKIVKINFVRG